jgi:hypothetical protein
MQRRNFIRLAGGGVVLAATGLSLSGCGMAAVPASAVAAWAGPAEGTDLRRAVLSYALLAPNPHNRQPWLAELVGNDQILLRLDPQRLLPATDPYGRQILMGAGAFLELLAMAAAQRGQQAQISLFPEGEPAQQLDGRPFASVRLVADAALLPDPLFAQVLNRRTDRRAYDPARAVDAAAAHTLKDAALPAGMSNGLRFGLASAAIADANGPAQAARVAAIRSLAREAWRIELSTEATMMESMRLIRVGSTEIDQHRDGITIDSPMLMLLSKVGLLDRTRFPGADSSVVANQVKDFDAITASTPAYLWLVTEGNARAQQVNAGRAYARVALAGTALGLAMHPNEQALQEYAEVAKPCQAMHQLLDAPALGHTVQILARVGYLPAGSAAAPPAPRAGLARQLRT